MSFITKNNPNENYNCQITTLFEKDSIELINKWNTFKNLDYCFSDKTYVDTENSLPPQPTGQYVSADYQFLGHFSQEAGTSIEFLDTNGQINQLTLKGRGEFHLDSFIAKIDNNKTISDFRISKLRVLFSWADKSRGKETIL